MQSSEVKKLQQIVKLANELLKSSSGGGKAAVVKKRRTSAEATEFRAMLKKEREKGVPVEQLAKKHKVTVSYIYQIK
jgi:Mor family transcriptional regulator